MKKKMPQKSAKPCNNMNKWQKMKMSILSFQFKTVKQNVNEKNKNEKGRLEKGYLGNPYTILNL